MKPCCVSYVIWDMKQLTAIIFLEFSCNLLKSC